jgi:anti-sigma regulatory factor (Ser/Thr protein kinase)
MSEAPHIRINLPDRSYQASVRSEIRKLAITAGFSNCRLGEVEIITAEITSNLWKHTDKGGYLLVRVMLLPEPGIEIIAIDDGPGMGTPHLMMEDGRSTKKTLGNGLGAIRRLANVFDLYSLKGWGTILFIRCYVNKLYREEDNKGFQINALCVCKKGQVVCGDSWEYTHTGNKIRLLMVDGLGHGPAANHAAEEAVQNFVNLPKRDPTEQIRSLHNKMKKSRGGVAHVAYIDCGNQKITYSGVGNVVMKLIHSARVKGCYSYNGIVGLIMPSSINNHMLPWHYNDIILMHTDGISPRWDIQKYPDILKYHPIILCSAIYKDFDRGNDDATILVGKFIKQFP